MLGAHRAAQIVRVHIRRKTTPRRGIADRLCALPASRRQKEQSCKMEFDGCYATILEVVKTPKSNIQTAVSFDLRNIQQDRIRFRSETGSGDTRVTPYFLVQLPFVRSAISVTTFSASAPPQTSTDASRSVSIVFQDLDTANRQAIAWRDAALACGARK